MRHHSGTKNTEEAMNRVEKAIRDLVVANRILANEGVVDAYGHVSVRHPENPQRYFLSRSRSPELVEQGDIIEFDLDSKPVSDKRQPYLERFIHGGIFAARPEINAVVHSHADSVLAFGVSPKVPLRCVVHTAGCMGYHIPVWDIREKFGDTNLLVVNNEQGRDLAATLGPDNVALMSAHGFAAAGRSLAEVVRIGVYLPKNAKVYYEALSLNGFRPEGVRMLSEREVQLKGVPNPEAPEIMRAWEYWAKRAGVGELLS
jgi:ribulose-5-phosphate 4-epimerase/fuculose-1-phosphate aldolase